MYLTRVIKVNIILSFYIKKLNSLILILFLLKICNLGHEKILNYGLIMNSCY